MAYDRADWHYGGDYPAELPPENGGTHIGMFLAWVILHELEGELHQENSAEALTAVRARTMTGREFLTRECDEKFWEEDLNAEANAFAHWYYEGNALYLEDYERVLGDSVETLYHVADTWQNYDLLAVVIDERFAEWQQRVAAS